MKTSNVVALLSAVILSACFDEEPEQFPMHQVIATVRGLEGEGLVLGMEGETLRISGDGDFTFRTRLEEGSRAEVTILAMPSHTKQDCTLTGSGELVTADGATVRVTCTTLQFSVGGTVSGLVGTVELELNGHPQEVSRNGPFKFKRQLPDGMEYSVRVSEQPSSLHCDVTGDSGLLDGEDVNSIVVTCTKYYHVLFTLSGATGPLTITINSVEYEGSENGEWQFGEEFSDGDAYEVTVTEPPPGQFCEVVNGVGKIMGADATDVTITCQDL